MGFNSGFKELNQVVYISLCLKMLDKHHGIGTVSFCFVPTGATAFLLFDC